ncbi:polysaccharide deacetylase family protein [Streptomyces sp. NPDC049577]|uniref:polysaccharide deacetylase family protein n=1 Tax=Streptomyces sp. NPDC049577 TaxID=3155153 RepID=UPI003427288C
MDRIRPRPPSVPGVAPRRPARLLLAVLLAVLAATACATPGPEPPAPGSGPRRQRVPMAQPHAAKPRAAPEQRAAAARRWGLEQPPRVPPPPPAVRPRLGTPRRLSRGPGLIPVITRVPTTDKVVFLTIDDGTVKDEEFTDMVRELDVPFSMFLTDSAVRDDYGYFRELHGLGHAAHNHTLRHPQLTRLGPEDQKRQICGQRDVMRRRFGETPRLFRPPYGDYDRDTLVIARECGAQAVLLWSEEAFPRRMAFRDGGRLRPGDIILTHFNGPRQWHGTMADMLRLVLRKATRQGFALARLEDYV